MHTNSMEESAAWGAGYDAGQEGLAKTIETAELLAIKRERERIIKLLELWWEDSDMTYQECIAQIKGAK